MQFPLNRAISLRITPWLARWKFAPNQVTALSLATGLLAAWNFLQGTDRAWIYGALWLEAAYLLDNCDGELARLTRKCSGLGSWLDTLSDCLIHGVFFLSLGYGLTRVRGDPLWMILGWAAAAGVLLTYGSFLFEQVQQRGPSAWRHPDLPFDERQTPAKRFRKIFREDFSWIVLISACAHQMSWLLWAGMLGAHAHWLLTGLTLFRTSCAGEKMRGLPS